MKKSLQIRISIACVLVIQSIFFISTPTANASGTLSLVAQDSFEYTGNVVGKNGGSGFAGPWATDYGVSDYGMNASGLTYSGLTTAGGYMYGCTATPNTVCGIKREIPLQNSGITYIQVLANFGSQTGGGTPMIRLFDASGTLSGGFGANGGTYGSKISILDTSGNPPSDGSASAGTLNSLTLVVFRIDYTNNSTAMFLNPDLSTFSYTSPPTPTVSLAGFAPVVKNIAFYSRNGYSKFDELKVYSVTASASTDDSAAQREREAARQAAIKKAREQLNFELANQKTIMVSELSAADLPLNTTNSLLAAYKELMDIKKNLVNPLPTEEVERLKFNKIMKYSMIERITGLYSGPVYARNLVEFGVIDSTTAMKQLATYKLMNLPVSERDSMVKVTAFYADFISQVAARKAHLLAIKAKIAARNG